MTKFFDPIYFLCEEARELHNVNISRGYNMPTFMMDPQKGHMARSLIRLCPSLKHLRPMADESARECVTILDETYRVYDEHNNFIAALNHRIRDATYNAWFGSDAAYVAFSNFEINHLMKQRDESIKRHLETLEDITIRANNNIASLLEMFKAHLLKMLDQRANQAHNTVH